MNRMIAWSTAAMLCLGSAAPVAAQTATTYPTKTIRIIVPFTPGGGNDISARFISQRLTEAFKQSVIVENRPGAGSTVGTDLVAKSAPDGYTLMVIHNAIAINQTLYPKLPYDAVRDFAQVALAGVTTNTLVVHPSLPAKNVKELIAMAKAKPGELNSLNVVFSESFHPQSTHTPPPPATPHRSTPMPAPRLQLNCF